MLKIEKKEFLLEKDANYIYIVDMNAENAQVDLSTRRLEIEFPETYKRHLNNVSNSVMHNKYMVAQENGCTLVLAYMVDRRFGSGKDSPQEVHLRLTSLIKALIEKFGSNSTFVSGKMYSNLIHWKKLKKIINSYTNLNWIVYEE